MHSRVRLTFVAVAAIVVAVFVPSVAEAHDPIIIDDSQTTPDAGPLLPDGTISFALYGVVDGPDATRGFRVRFADGDRLVVSLLIPDLPPEQALPDDELPVLRVDAPDGSARELAPDVRIAFDEPFSGTRYVRLVDLEEPAIAGEYAITVIGNAPARFTVSVGTIEQFGTPAEGVVDRDAGVAGVQAWYATPPPEPAIAAPATTFPAATAPPTTAPPTSPAPPPTPAVTDVSPTGPATTSAPATTSGTAPSTAPAGDDGEGDGSTGLLLGIVVAVALAGALIALLPRRRSGSG